jgi:hypothetical protein
MSEVLSDAPAPLSLWMLESRKTFSASMAQRHLQIA